MSANPLYLAVEKSIKHFDLLAQNAIVTDAAIHRYLQFALLYRPLLSNLKFLGLITSRDLRAPLSQLFNIDHIELYQIKGEKRFPGDVQEDHYPEHFEWLKSNIQVPFKGAVFLVGAGGLGKIYCDVIKQKGGIAIDIGSIFDAWAKVKSRLAHPAHSIDRYSDMPQISLDSAIIRYNKLIRILKFDTSLAKAKNMKGSLLKW
jgi:hypothetical protein